MKGIYCRGEAGRFPDDEFAVDQNGNVVHMKGVPHYKTGEPVVIPDGDPTISILMARHLLSQMSRTDAEEVINSVITERRKKDSTFYKSLP